MANKGPFFSTRFIRVCTNPAMQYEYSSLFGYLNLQMFVEFYHYFLVKVFVHFHSKLHFYRSSSCICGLFLVLFGIQSLGDLVLKRILKFLEFVHRSTNRSDFTLKPAGCFWIRLQFLFASINLLPLYWDKKLNIRFMNISMFYKYSAGLKFLFVLTCMSIFAFSACTKDFLDENYHRKEIFDAAYLNIYGKWRLIESANAISGGFQAYFDHLEIYTYGNFRTIRNDTILQKGVVEIVEQTSVKLKIDFVPLYSIPTGSKWVKFFGTDTLKLTDSCTECNYYVFARD